MFGQWIIAFLSIYWSYFDLITDISHYLLTKKHILTDHKILIICWEKYWSFTIKYWSIKYDPKRILPNAGMVATDSPYDAEYFIWSDNRDCRRMLTSVWTSKHRVWHKEWYRTYFDNIFVDFLRWDLSLVLIESPFNSP